MNLDELRHERTSYFSWLPRDVLEYVLILFLSGMLSPYPLCNTMPRKRASYHFVARFNRRPNVHVRLFEEGAVIDGPKNPGSIVQRQVMDVQRIGRYWTYLYHVRYNNISRLEIENNNHARQLLDCPNGIAVDSLALTPSGMVLFKHRDLNDMEVHLSACSLQLDDTLSLADIKSAAIAPRIRCKPSLAGVNLSTIGYSTRHCCTMWSSAVMGVTKVVWMAVNGTVIERWTVPIEGYFTIALHDSHHQRRIAIARMDTLTVSTHNSGYPPADNERSFTEGTQTYCVVGEVALHFHEDGSLFIYQVDGTLLQLR